MAAGDAPTPGTYYENSFKYDHLRLLAGRGNRPMPQPVGHRLNAGFLAVQFCNPKKNQFGLKFATTSGDANSNGQGDRSFLINAR